MIILKGKVPHTTHHTQLHKTFTKKKWKRKTAKKAKCTSIKQRKAKGCTKLSDNLYSVSSPEEAHKLNRRLWDSKYREMFLLHGLQDKERLWRHRWVVAILLYSGGSRPSDKRGQSADPEIKRRGGGGWCPKQFFSALWAPVWSKDYGWTVPPGPPLDLLLLYTKCAVDHSPTPASQNVISLVRWHKQTSLRSKQCP